MLLRLNEWLGRRSAIAGAALVAVSFLVYTGSLANGFLTDDVPFILQNPFVQNPRLWSRIFEGSMWAFQGGRSDFYRPLQFFSYAIVYRLTGPDPATLHFIQLLLYSVTVGLMFALGRKLLQSDLAAFAATLLWAVHPLHVEAVAWISSLSEVGFGCFYLLAFLVFLHAERMAGGPRLRFHALAALAFLGALLFKEMALSFPLVLLAYWLLVAERERWLSRAARWSPYLAAVAIYLALRIIAIGGLASTPQAAGWTSRAKAALALLGSHTRLFFWPGEPNYHRPFEISSSLHSVWPWFILLILAVTLGRRKHEPLLGFLVVWWVLGLVPCLDIRYLKIPCLTDRYSYLPSVALCMAGGLALFARLPARFPQARWAVFLLPALALASLMGAVQTVRAIPFWRNDEAMCDRALAQSPSDPLVHFNRAGILQYQYGDLAGARKEYETAMRLAEADPPVKAAMTFQYLLAHGQMAHRQGRTDEAIRYLEKAIRASRENKAAYDALGAVYFPRGDYARAAGYFQQAVQVNPYDPGSRFYLGTCWMKLGEYPRAVEQFRTARVIDPTYREAYEAEARALEASGDSAGATEVRKLAGSGP